jgi:hypothetical protein
MKMATVCNVGATGILCHQPKLVARLIAQGIVLDHTYWWPFSQKPVQCILATTQYPNQPFMHWHHHKAPMLGCTGFSQGFSELGLNLKSLLLGLSKPWWALPGSIHSLDAVRAGRPCAEDAHYTCGPHGGLARVFLRSNHACSTSPGPAGGHGKRARMRQNGQATRGITLVARCIQPTDDTMGYPI